MRKRLYIYIQRERVWKVKYGKGVTFFFCKESDGSEDMREVGERKRKWNGGSRWMMLGLEQLSVKDRECL